MSKLRTSKKISEVAKAEVSADIILFMYGNRKNYISPYSEIYKQKNGWNIIELKFSILNFTMPDIPYMDKKKINDNKWKFKFDIDYTYDTTDYTIVNRNDLKTGEKILILVVMNWSSLGNSDFWKAFYKKMPKKFLEEKLSEI